MAVAYALHGSTGRGGCRGDVGCAAPRRARGGGRGGRGGQAPQAATACAASPCAASPCAAIPMPHGCCPAQGVQQSRWEGPACSAAPRARGEAPSLRVTRGAHLPRPPAPAPPPPVVAFKNPGQSRAIADRKRPPARDQCWPPPPCRRSAAVGHVPGSRLRVRPRSAAFGPMGSTPWARCISTRRQAASRCPPPPRLRLPVLPAHTAACRRPSAHSRVPPPHGPCACLAQAWVPTSVRTRAPAAWTSICAATHRSNGRTSAGTARPSSASLRR